MRLYLSSYRIGDRAGALLAMLGSGKRAALISNALDNISPVAREIYRESVFDPVAQLASLGIVAEDFDLRRYFSRPEALGPDLARFDLVWVMGGNVFTLRRAMARSGFDTAIRDRLARDSIVYGGFSAGAVVAGPSLVGLELMDDPADVPENYDKSVVWDGLGLIPYTIVPHFRSNHPESAGAEKLVNYLRARRLPYRGLSDGEVVVAAGARGAERPELMRIA
jgi:dipeptidase E